VLAALLNAMLRHAYQKRDLPPDCGLDMRGSNETLNNAHWAALSSGCCDP